jgi:TRAP-type C4-dicarboxylate transport system substrate-binding protein
MRFTYTKRSLAFGLAVAIMGFVGLWSNSVSAADLRVAHSSNPGQSVYIYWDEFAKLVNKRAGGEIVLKVFPSGQLGGDEQLQRGLKAGTIHFASGSSSNMGIVSDAYSWGDLPYVFRSPQHAEKVFNDKSIKDYINGKMRADAGTVVLGHVEVGGFRILINTQRELKSPGDVNGMKFRMLSNPIDQALLTSWGGNPVAMPWSETFVSIEQGVADGLQLQPQAIAGFNFDKMIRYGTHTKTLMTVHVAQMNAKTWDGLSADLQAVITTSAADALKIANDADRADAAKFMENLATKIKFYEPTEEEFEQWRSSALKVWDKFRDKIDADILARVVEVQK